MDTEDAAKVQTGKKKKNIKGKRPFQSVLILQYRFQSDFFSSRSKEAYTSQDFVIQETALQLHYCALLLWARFKSIQNGISNQSEYFPFFLHGKKVKSLRASKADKNCIAWQLAGPETDSVSCPRSEESKAQPPI